MATEAFVAFAPSDVYCDLGLWGANVAMVYGQNQPPQGCSLGEPPVQLNLKGYWVNRFTCGHPGPPAFTQQSVRAWAIAHRPS